MPLKYDHAGQHVDILIPYKILLLTTTRTTKILPHGILIIDNTIKYSINNTSDQNIEMLIQTPRKNSRKRTLLAENKF